MITMFRMFIATYYGWCLLDNLGGAKQPFTDLLTFSSVVRRTFIFKARLKRWGGWIDGWMDGWMDTSCVRKLVGLRHCYE